MSDCPLKPGLPSPSTPSEPAPPERRRRGRVLLAASAVGAAFTMAGCGSLMTTNPAPCVYDGGLYDDDCNPDNGPNGAPSDGGADAGPDAGLPQVP